MAITVVTPNGGEIFYDYRNNTTGHVNTNPHLIEWTSTTNNDVIIRYSKDNGSTWATIADNISSSSTGTNSYNWQLTDAQYLDIIGTANKNELVLIQIEDKVTAESDNSDANFDMRAVSFELIVPNASHTSNKYYDDEIIQILWNESYDTEAATNVTISFRESSDGNTWGSWQVIETGINNTGHYNWDVPQDDGVTPDYYFQIRIQYEALDHTGNVGYSEGADNASGGFIITDDQSLVPNPTNHRYADTRYEIGSRTAVEKAAHYDEAIALGQLEAGYGIVIEQRDINGLLNGLDRNGDASNDPFAALNIRIRTVDTLPRPREIQGDLDYPNNGTVDATISPGIYYGRSVYIDIVHNWHLGDAVNDINYVVGKTQNSFQLECRQINGSGDRTIPEFKVEPHWEAIDEDTIRVYCSIKGLEDDLGNPGSAVDDSVTQAKDQLAIDPGTYYFEFTLKEVIPNP